MPGRDWHRASHPVDPGASDRPPTSDLEGSALGRTRTCGQLLRRQLLYPLSYEGVASATLAVAETCSPGSGEGANIRHGLR
jgi:hypothetical protein